MAEEKEFKVHEFSSEEPELTKEEKQNLGRFRTFIVFLIVILILIGLIVWQIIAIGK